MRRASDITGEAAGRIIDWTLPRGLRNNNPGNIDRKAGTTWRGMSADQSTDSRFVVFEAPEWGIRAIARVLKSYRARGVDTLREVITTWAPPTENDTVSYITQVARVTGLSPDDPVTDGHLPSLIAAIIQHENGQQPYSQDVILRGVELERSA